MFVAFLIAPAALRALAEGSLARENYRGRVLACPLGVVIVAAALCALIPLAIAQAAAGGVLRPELGWIAVYVLGVAFLGLADDALADGARGWRGHAAALLRRRVRHRRAEGVRRGGARALRDGRAGDGSRALPARGGGARAGHQRLQPPRPAPRTGDQGLRRARRRADAGERRSAAPVGGRAVRRAGARVGLYDVRELGLLGDTGANVVGALAGAWLVLTLSDAGLAVALVAALRRSRPTGSFDQFPYSSSAPPGCAT